MQTVTMPLRALKAALTEGLFAANDCSDTVSDYNNRKYNFYDPQTGDITPIDGFVIRAQKDYLILKKDDALEIYPEGTISRM